MGSAAQSARPRWISLVAQQRRPFYHTSPFKKTRHTISRTTVLQAPKDKLQRSWLLFAALAILAWFGSYLLQRHTWPSPGLWLLYSGIVLSYVLWTLWRALPLNTRPGQTELLPTLGWGNYLSLLRGLIIALLAGFLFAPRPSMPLAWLIAGLYTAASVADWLDGYVARRTNHVTVLGQRLDIEFDGLGVAVVTLLAVSFGQLPPWFLGVALARYLFVLGLWWRTRAGRPVYELPPSVHRRVMAGMLMGMMTVVLWPIVPAAMVTVGGIMIGMPVLLGFLRDWLFVSGRLTAESQRYLRLQRGLYVLSARSLPPLWRILLFAAMVVILRAADPWFQPQNWLGLLLSWHVPVAGATATALAVVALLGITAVLLGFAGRLGAVLLFFPIGFDIATRGLLWANGLALVCALGIALFGTGPFSLWQPEAAYINQRSG